MKIIRLHLPLAFSERSKLICLATDIKPKVEVSLGRKQRPFTPFGKGPLVYFSLAGESNICPDIEDAGC